MALMKTIFADNAKNKLRVDMVCQRMAHIKQTQINRSFERSRVRMIMRATLSDLKTISLIFT